jgi:splicing factor 3A subunit 1
MASTTNGDAAAALDELKPPPGVVLPPREIRNVLEKTAGYVARNGHVFEDRIRAKESANPKFSFLDPSDAYHPYYGWRLSEIRSGRGTAIAAGRAGESATPVPEKPKGPPKPPDFQFSARQPRINQKDLDVMRLAALFVAKNGRQWMSQLAQREASNPQFSFLAPNHTFHNFFQHVVNQYTILLKAGGLEGGGGKVQDEILADLQENVNNKWRVLERAKQRAEYSAYVEMEKRQKEEEEEQKKVEFERIDWGDFVVVETITFSEADDNTNLPPPTTLADLQYASLEDRQLASISSNMRIEEAFPGEEDTYSAPSYNGHAAPVQPTYPLHTGYAPQQPAYPSPNGGMKSAQEEEEERRIQERAENQARMQQAQSEARGGVAPMKIKENYVPRAAQKAASRQGAQMALCPNCKQQIPMNELEEHMRSKLSPDPFPRPWQVANNCIVELLDPRWKEQKAKAETRYATTNISHAEVANNLKRLASQRSDLFDPVTGQVISEEEQQRRKKAAISSFDGNPEKTAGHVPNVNVEEQIRNIHQKFSGGR